MKKILLSIFGIISLGLINFGSCQDICSCENEILQYQEMLGSCYNSVINLSGDLASCQSDLLNCGGSMTGSCQENTGDIQWSSLYINDIQHLSSENIVITIPEEISWDYTGDGENFYLDIVGYNVDSDYIAGIIENQTTLPNQVDLNNLITGVIPLFVPGLFIVSFLYFVFRFIKKFF